MNKNFIIDYVNHKIVIACGPEFSIECEEWYPDYYARSINDYIKILNTFMQYNGESSFLLSYYDPHRELNIVEKKRGMAGVFQHFNKTYQSDSEMIIEKSWTNIIISVVQYNQSNLNILFSNLQPKSILCVGSNISSENLLRFHIDEEFDLFLKDFLQYGSIAIKYNEVGCDGNNITIYTKNDFNKYNVISNILISAGYVELKKSDL